MSVQARVASTMTPSALLTRVSSEVRDSATVRLGLLAAAAIVWIYLLLVANDARTSARERLAQLEDRVATARAEERDRSWPGREASARQQLAALRALLWRAPNRSLAEAGFRDWIQNAAQTMGLKIRTLTVQTADRKLANPSSVAAPLASGAPPAIPLPDDVERVRARITVDFARQPWAAFLLKLAGSARIVNVERIAIHNNTTQGAVAELDLEALFLLEAAGR
jgi:hypothetical protein